MPCDYKKIAEQNLRKYGTEIERIGEMLLAHHYSDRTHFVYELLQNAEDAIRLRKNNAGLPRSVCFTLDHDHLEFTHYGLPFEEKHVSAICGIGESTKEDELTAIGHFGIGFKSVYAFSKKPEIHSGDEHFVIDAFVRPRMIAERRTSIGQTLFCFPFADTDAYKEILKRLEVLGHRTLLFLKEIDSIEWKEMGGSNGIFLREATHLGTNIRRVTLYGESSEGTKAEPEDWLVFSRDVFKNKEEKAGQVEIAYALTKDENGNHLITPVTDSPLVVFFPTEKETNLGFLVQGPYKTTPSRDNIPKDDTWNQYLIAESSLLVKDSLRKLSQMNLLSVGVIRAMPLDRSKFKPPSWSAEPEHMFKPIFDSVKDSFREEELIPRHGGGYVSGKCSKIARTDGLRNILDSIQLTQLYRAEKALSWITADVTYNRTPEVRRYLMQELDIDEVDTDSLLPLFTQDFLAQQTDDWIASLYAFLLDQSSLWRDGGFRLKPIIRLENGEQVIPFDEFGTPKVFLPGPARSGFRTVKESVCKNIDALRFLKAFGLTEPDPVDDVIENVLAQFTDDLTDLDDASYQKAITKIIDAFQTDSESQRKKLLNALHATAFLRSKNAGSNEILFKCPEVVYIPTDSLQTLFSGSEEVWFVDRTDEALTGESARQFLEACGVRTYLRREQCESSLSSDERLELRRAEGATNWSRHSITDYDVIGLREAALRISSLCFEQAEPVAASLWRVLTDTLREARETFFRGTYAWAYFHSEWKRPFPAQFVRDLRTVLWVPTAKGELRAPQQVCFSEVARSITDSPNPILQELLGFRPETIMQLAKEAGIELETIELVKKHGLTTDRLREMLEHAGLVDSPGEEAPAAPPQPGGGGKGHPGEGTGPATPPPPGTDHPDGQTRFFSYVYTSPDSDDHSAMSPEEIFRREKIGRDGVDYVIEQEGLRGVNVKEMPHTNEGYDLETYDDSGNIERYIEVKATGQLWGTRGVTLSDPQFRHARQLKDKYWLYVVEKSGKENCKLYRIQNPAMNIGSYVFDGGWKQIAVGTDDASEQED